MGWHTELSSQIDFWSHRLPLFPLVQQDAPEVPQFGATDPELDPEAVPLEVPEVLPLVEPDPLADPDSPEPERLPVVEPDEVPEVLPDWLPLAVPDVAPEVLPDIEPEPEPELDPLEPVTMSQARALVQTGVPGFAPCSTWQSWQFAPISPQAWTASPVVQVLVVLSQQPVQQTP